MGGGEVCGGWSGLTDVQDLGLIGGCVLCKLLTREKKGE